MSYENPTGPSGVIRVVKRISEGLLTVKVLAVDDDGNVWWRREGGKEERWKLYKKATID